MEKNILGITFGQFFGAVKMHLYDAASAEECSQCIAEEEGAFWDGDYYNFREKPFYVVRYSEDLFEAFIPKDILTAEEYKILNSLDGSIKEEMQFLKYLKEVLNFYI
jgi:hypothetical protein